MHVDGRPPKVSRGQSGHIATANLNQHVNNPTTNFRTSKYITTSNSNSSNNDNDDDDDANERTHGVGVFVALLAAGVVLPPDSDDIRVAALMTAHIVDSLRHCCGWYDDDVEEESPSNPALVDGSGLIPGEERVRPIGKPPPPPPLPVPPPTVVL